MSLRLALVVRDEFLLLVLRQLLRRHIGVDIISERQALTASLAFEDCDALIIERSLCSEAGDILLALLKKWRGAVILIGEHGALPPEIAADSVAIVPAGSRDPTSLDAGLRSLLGSLRQQERGPAIPTLAAEPTKATPARPLVVGIAASTGGPETLAEILTALAPPTCPIVIALHIPAEHAVGLAQHLANISGHGVTLAAAGPLPAAGILLLPGGVDHAVVKGSGGLWLRKVASSASPFHPNGDILLNSLAALDCPVVGIVLTGMGDDGSEGARALNQRGQMVLAQRPSSCAVDGMPKAAIAAGAVGLVAVPVEIAGWLNGWFTRTSD